MVVVVIVFVTRGVAVGGGAAVLVTMVVARRVVAPKRSCLALLSSCRAISSFPPSVLPFLLLSPRFPLLPFLAPKAGGSLLTVC